MSVILGLNGIPFEGHDPAAALIVDGSVVAAVEEERLCRVKRAIGLPPARSVREVMRIAGIAPQDVDVVALPWIPRAMGYDNVAVEEDVRRWLSGLGFRDDHRLHVRFVAHHIAHAWSGLAFVPGSLRGRRIGVLVLDGSGESTSGAAYLFNQTLSCLWHVQQSSSVGLYYEAATHYLGFSWGEEGKTMGLAAYGRELDLKMPLLADERLAAPPGDWITSSESPVERHARFRHDLVLKLQQFHGQQLTFNQRADIALAAQQQAKMRVMSYVGELITKVDGLVLSGGVALNCAINATVAAQCRANGVELVIPPPASDTGVALGAAVAAVEDPLTIKPIAEPFLGINYPPHKVIDDLRAMGATVKHSSSEEIASMLVEENLVLGWFEGRSEIGPRALGKRSIIARPDSAKIRDRINFLKSRESWRPLAPSLTAAEFSRSFGNSAPSRYMLINATNCAHQESLRGVIHVDGTSRPQVVTEAGPYRALLSAVGVQTGCEAIICTSFNMAGEPIVYSPMEALSSAQAMGLDGLAGDGWITLLTRSS